MAWWNRPRADVWNLALVPAPIHATLTQPLSQLPVERVTAPAPGTFRADPFGLRWKGQLTILFERYDLVARRGSIWSAQLQDDGSLIDEQPALTVPGHASYPYLVEEGGAVFCVPETFGLNEVALYRAVEFPARWAKEAVLLSGMRVADATVFPFEGRWWLACVSLDVDTGAGTERLYLFHAPALTGPYRPHEGNPVKVSRRGARPGGTPFVHGGKLYRPGQDCSRTYGGGVIVHEVCALSPTTFAEVEVAALDGTALDAEGLHTLAAVGDATLIDLKNARGPRRS